MPVVWLLLCDAGPEPASLFAVRPMSQGPAHAVPAPRTMTEQPARISRFMFMRVSSFFLSRAPTEQEIKETDAMVAWFQLIARLFDALERVAIRLAAFLRPTLRCFNRFVQSPAARFFPDAKGAENHHRRNAGVRCRSDHRPLRHYKCSHSITMDPDVCTFASLRLSYLKERFVCTVRGVTGGADVRPLFEPARMGKVTCPAGHALYPITSCRKVLTPSWICWRPPCWLHGAR